MTVSRCLAPVLFLAAMSLPSLSRAAAPVWSELPPLPPAPGQARQAGVAGPYAGAHGDAFFVAGGANFPDTPPWHGGVKAWWDTVWVLLREADGRCRWAEGDQGRLPRAMGYGVTFATPEGVVCVGGADGERCYADVFRLAWDPVAKRVTRTDLPPLPVPLAFAGGAQIGSVLYVVGGQETVKAPRFSARLFALDLADLGRPGAGWKELPPLPGPARMLPAVGTAGRGAAARLLAFSGRLPRAGQPAQLLGDGYAYDPVAARWTKLGDVRIDGRGEALCLMGATVATDGAGLWVFGGDRGGLFARLEAADLEVEALRAKQKEAGADVPALQGKIDALLQGKIAIYNTHPGFSDQVLHFDPATDVWTPAGRMPVSGPVTTQAVPWGEAWIIPSGEERPGIRTTRLLRVVLPRLP